MGATYDPLLGKLILHKHEVDDIPTLAADVAAAEQAAIDAQAAQLAAEIAAAGSGIASSEADAIQLLRLHNPDLVFSGFVNTSTSTPLHTVNKAYIATGAGTIFGLTGVPKGAVIRDNGTVFVAEIFAPIQISSIENKVGAVLFNVDDFSNQAYISFITGADSPTANYRRTNKIWLPGGTILKVIGKGTSTVALLAVYDENNAFIQSESVQGDSTLKTATITIQGNGRYIACSTDYTEVDNSGLVIDPIFTLKSVFNEVISNIEATYATKVEAIKDTDLTLIPGLNLAEMNILSSKNDPQNGVFLGWIDDSYVPQSTTDGASQWRTYKFDCSGYQGLNLTFGTTNSSYRRWVFYNGATQLNYGTYPANAAQTVAVPVDATLLYVLLRRYEATESFANWRINTGNSLLDYEPYISFIKKIKGKEFVFNTALIDAQLLELTNKTTALSVIPKTIRLYPKTKIPVINFQFDWSSGGSTPNDVGVAELFELNGTRCGFALGSSIMADEPTISTYLEYQRKGHSILNHPGSLAFTLANFPTIQDAFNQIMNYQIPLIKQGFVINGFVAAGSQYAPELIEAVEKVYAYGATYADSGNNGRTSNPCTTTRFSLENTTRAAAKKYMLELISVDKCISFYGHTYNFGITGHAISEITFTITAVNIVAGSGTIEVQGTLPINAGTYAGSLTRMSGGGDTIIAFTNVAIDSNYIKNTLTVSGITIAPSVGNTYSYVADDEWNLTKLEDILQFGLDLQDLRQCQILAPDEAYQYFFSL